MQLRLSFTGALLLLAGAAVAQHYPDKAVTMIAPFPAGGSVDLVARAVAQQMSELWKQPVVVANRPGAGGNIGAEGGRPRRARRLYAAHGHDRAREQPGALLETRLRPDARSRAGEPRRHHEQRAGGASCAARALGAELLALAKARPGTLNSASAGVGSSNHLALVLFNTMTGANIAHIPYKGAAPAVADVMGGHVAMTFVPIAAAVPPVKSGRLRALGVTGATRSAALPDVPTINEAGVAGYEATSWNALLAPGQRRAISCLESTPRWWKACARPRCGISSSAPGADAAGNTPDELAGFLRAEMVKWGKVVRAAGIKPE